MSRGLVNQDAAAAATAAFARVTGTGRSAPRTHRPALPPGVRSASLPSHSLASSCFSVCLPEMHTKDNMTTSATRGEAAAPGQLWSMRLIERQRFAKSYLLGCKRCATRGRCPVLMPRVDVQARRVEEGGRTQRPAGGCGQYTLLHMFSPSSLSLSVSLS